MEGRTMAVSGKSKKELIEENKSLRSRLKSLKSSGAKDYKSSEQELRRSQERLITVLDSLDALVYVADMETHEVLFVNKFGRDICGDVVGKTCWKTLQSRQTGPCEFCTNAKLIDNSGRPTGIHRSECQNTVDQQWYDCRDQAIKWTDNRLVRIEIATNITEQKNAQDELKKSKEFLDNVINSLEDSFFIKDQEHRWLMLNDAACELMGRPREELIGKSDYDLFPKEQADIFWEKDNLVFETGKTNLNEEQVTWHGKVHTISTKKSLYIDPVTGQKFITGTNRDITELKKAQNSLRQSEEKFRSMFELSPYSTVLSDLKGNIIACNRQFAKLHATKEGPEAQVGRNVLEFFPEEERLRLSSSLKNKAEGRKKLDQFEYIMLREDGTKFRAEAKSTVVLDKNGKPHALIATAHDITKR
ncbi:MAG: PAS domain S-box protein, partial [Sedimentisphaerales bacterium]|nr:PAS domain S-box protein [Sedimentisphaerales bacterium]